MRAEDWPDPVTVAFENADATPSRRELMLWPKDVADVVQWYGAFHTGDSYTVTVNDVACELTQDGELVAFPQLEGGTD